MPKMRNGKEFNRRPEYLNEKQKECRVYRGYVPGTYLVLSPSHSVYKVRITPLGEFHCECDWARYHRDLDCSHTVAVRDTLARGEGRYLALWEDEEAAKRQRKPRGEISDGLWVTMGKVKVRA